MSTKKTVQSTDMFVAGTKSDFTDTNTTMNKFNIVEKNFLYVSGYVRLTSSHKNIYQSYFVRF